MSGGELIAKPAEHFARPPYRAECLDGPKGGAGWWGVMNADGINCLTLCTPDGKPTGKTVTDKQQAMDTAQRWNDGRHQ